MSGIELISKNKIINNKIKVKDCPEYGIYFLLKDDEIVYIGQTTKGISRVYSHIYNSNKDFDSFSFFRCKKAFLNEVESYHILLLRPKYNNCFMTDEYFSLKSIKKIMGRICFTNNLKYIKPVICQLCIKPVNINNKEKYHYKDVIKLVKELVSYEI